METKYNISVLLATRGRTDQLGRSVRSLFELANDPAKIEIVFAFDKDDTPGLTYFTSNLKPWMDERKIAYTALSFTRMGYTNLHKYTNAMAPKATGKWMIIWNDDAVMEEQGWDTTIMTYDGQFKLLAFDTHNAHPYSIFPIMPREWYDLLGYLSPHPSQDAWVSQQAYMLDIMERTTIKVLHDRHDLTGNNEDDTFEERRMLEGNPHDLMDFHSVPQTQLRHTDTAKLGKYAHEKYNTDMTFFNNVFLGKQDPWEKLAKNDINGQMVQFDNPHKTAKAPMYSLKYFQHADGIRSWHSGSLKFGDALAALGYAHGITWDQVKNEYPEVFAKYGDGHSESDGKRYIDEQIAFLQREAKHTPKRVLEIGGGRGEVSSALKKMGIDVVSVELSPDAAAMFSETGKRFFGPDFEPVVPIARPIQDVINDLDLSTFDTILMVESLEHIPEPAFNPVWDKIVKEFHGRFVAVNWPDYHPIWIGRDAGPEEHCRLVDDALYDAWTAQAKSCWFRRMSHIVLDF